MLKGQDVLILLKLLILKNSNWKILDLSNSLNISPSEVSSGIQRLHASKLVDKISKKPIHKFVREFLLYGFKYFFPPEFGIETRGVPTAHCAPPLNKYFIDDKSSMIVWPFEEGQSRGVSLKPIYPSVPKAVANNQELHEYLALLDALRIGRVREVNRAKKELRKRIK